MEIVNDTLIKKWEKLELRAYMPTPNDRWTIGWGHTHTTKKGQVINKKRAQELFEIDTAWVEKVIADKVKVSLNQNQYDAIASLIFNIGETNFHTSTLLRKLNKGDFEGASQEFPRWNKQGRKVLRGLVRRRAEEMEVFLDSLRVYNTSGTIDTVSKPSKVKSKTTWGGILATATGVVPLLGVLPPESAKILLYVLPLSLIAVGALLLVSEYVRD